MSAHPAHVAGVTAYRELLETVDDPAGCGACEDCTVRVILEAAAPLLEADALARRDVVLRTATRPA